MGQGIMEYGEGRPNEDSITVSKRRGGTRFVVDQRAVLAAQVFDDVAR